MNSDKSDKMMGRQLSWQSSRLLIYWSLVRIQYVLPYKNTLRIQKRVEADQRTPHSVFLYGKVLMGNSEVVSQQILILLFQVRFLVPLPWSRQFSGKTAGCDSAITGSIPVLLPIVISVTNSNNQ